jgi:O-antigen/teichoic acid export membrane protein
VDVGNFKAAQNFVTLITVLSIPITTALLPAFSKLGSSSNGNTKDFFKFANKYTSLLIVPTAVVIMIFSNEIVKIIYGSTYELASLFLSMYCPLYFLVGIGYLTLSSLFNGLGETRIVLRTTLVNVLISVVLTPLLTKIYGVPGLITAFLISNAGGTSYASYIATRRFKIEFATKSIVKIYSISIIAAAPQLVLLQLSALSMPLKVAIGGLFYVFAYATLIPLTKIITLWELEKAAQIVQKTKLLSGLIKPVISYQKVVLSYTLGRDTRKVIEL